MENKDVKEFELSVILSLITGINYADNFSKVCELVWFVCDDNMIGTMDLRFAKDNVRNHLLNLYPQFGKIKSYKDIKRFLVKNKMSPDDLFIVTKLGVELPKKDQKQKTK